jgi:hypothetical protein
VPDLLLSFSSLSLAALSSSAARSCSCAIFWSVRPSPAPLAGARWYPHRNSNHRGRGQ